MLRRISNRIEEQRGFTLIELLVVILIIGILAAIALPAFLGQRVKGQDSDAKSNARNVVSEIESCFTETDTYASPCPGQAIADAGLTAGTAGGQVTVIGATSNAFTVGAESKSGNGFSISRGTDGRTSRSCDTGGSDKGGCKGGSW